MKLLSLTRVFTFIIILYSGFVMTGWFLGIDAFTRLHPDQINMKFTTALCFFLSGIALLFMESALNNRREYAQLVIPGTATLTFLLMATLLVSGVFKVRTGIEDLFINDPGSSATVIPGMPAIPTMVGFVLFGLISISTLYESSKVKLIARVLFPVIGLIGIFPTLGYILNIPVLYYKINQLWTPIALNTALLFILIALAVWALIRIENVS